MQELNKYYNRLQNKNKMQEVGVRETKQLEVLHEDLKTIFNNLKISVDNISTSLDKWSAAEEKSPNTEMDNVHLYEGEGVYSVLAGSIEAIKQLVNKNNQNQNRLDQII